MSFTAAVGSEIVEDHIQRRPSACDLKVLYTERRPSACDLKALYRFAMKDESVWMQHEVVVSVVQRDNVEATRNMHKLCACGCVCGKWGCSSNGRALA